MATMTVRIEPESIVQDFIARIRPYLERNPIDGAVAEIIEATLHLEGEQWHVPVRLPSPEARTYDHYAMLVDTEDEIEEQEGLDVSLMPAG
jgi:hypothetical protein